MRNGFQQFINFAVIGRKQFFWIFAGQSFFSGISFTCTSGRSIHNKVIWASAEGFVDIAIDLFIFNGCHTVRNIYFFQVPTVFNGIFLQLFCTFSDFQGTQVWKTGERIFFHDLYRFQGNLWNICRNRVNPGKIFGIENAVIGRKYRIIFVHGNRLQRFWIKRTDFIVT